MSAIKPISLRAAVFNSPVGIRLFPTPLRPFFSHRVKRIAERRLAPTSPEEQGPTVFLPSFPKCGKDSCSICDLHEPQSLQPSLPVRGWGAARTSPEERGPIEAPLRRKAETDRVREGISEGCRSAEPDRVAPGGARAVEPQPRIHSSCPSVSLYVGLIVRID